MFKDDDYEISERLKMLKEIKLEYNKDIQPKVVLGELTKVSQDDVINKRKYSGLKVVVS